jgi:endonuclease-3
MLDRIEEAVRPFPKAAMFALAEEGFSSAFEVLVACIISIRTRDETTLEVARALFAVARTPEEMLALSPARIDALIHASTFHDAKARQIHDIARRVVHEHRGVLPARFDVLTSFHGVGPKCANLTIGVTSGLKGSAKGAPEDLGIGVDVHVHRVTNRWGYVAAPTPERTMTALHAVLPRRHWVRINALLVPFGKHVCTGVRPKCSECPVREFCRQVGVTDPR